jgi:hypothetical protein
MCWLKTWMPWSVVVGGIYSPNHQSGHWGRLLSTSAPDSLVRHRTLSGAPATSPNHWGSIVGALTSGATGQSGGAPDRSCSLSGAPSGACSDSARAVAHCSLFTFAFADDRWRCSHYSAWHTGQSGAPDQGSLRFSLLLWFEPFILYLYWFVVNLWHLWNIYSRIN